jgi:hypothetical protein
MLRKKSVVVLLETQYTANCIKRRDFGPRQPAYSGKVVAAKKRDVADSGNKTSQKSAT